MTGMDDGYGYPATRELWQTGDLGAGNTEILRSALHAGYAAASDDEVEDALGNIVESMSPAEALNFASALQRMGKSAVQLMSDPTVASIAQTALPVVGGAIAGPAGASLGTLAASALPARAPASVPASAQPAGGSPAVSGGSSAAARGLVLTQHPDVLRGLLAAALGQHGTQTVSGLPVAQVLGLVSKVFGEAAADADELMYLGQQAESIPAADDPADALYADLLGADDMEIAEAAGWDWPDR
jgi:hypothetical protein